MSRDQENSGQGGVNGLVLTAGVLTGIILNQTGILGKLFRAVKGWFNGSQDESNRAVGESPSQPGSGANTPPSPPGQIKPAIDSAADQGMRGNPHPGKIPDKNTLPPPREEKTRRGAGR